MVKKNFQISVVIPVYNEWKSLEKLNKELALVLDKIGKTYEILFIDDGSTDASLETLKDIRKKNKKVKVISFRKNFGQTAALSAGFDNAQGEIVITLDADLQNDPKDIPKLLKKMDEGYDVVSGWRKERKDPYFTRTIPSRVANWLISKVSGVALHDYGCTLKAYKKEIVKEIKLYGEMHRFIPAIAVTIGASIGEVEVKHFSRKYGKSKYGVGRTFRVILDLFTVKFLLSYQTRPIQLFGGVGFLFSLFGGGIFLRLVYERQILNRALADRPLFLVSILFILVGVQLLTTGLMAEMIVRLYYESQGKTTYFTKEII